MNKIIVILCIFSLWGCSLIPSKAPDADDRYFYLIDMLNEHETFSETSRYFAIEVEMAKIDNGYRYYIIIDDPQLAMYDIELIAIEKDVDYSENMAANIGVFEDTQYNMIPNQSNVEDGYVKGLIASGISRNPETTLYVFVQFKNADYSVVHNEYLVLPCRYEG
ncbi:MAG: hypothetical protein IKS51_04125 [Erysipelotrichaceae bacterium]|nr:hypothetical protein [Erysipelotrichaceae bacterium]